MSSRRRLLPAPAVAIVVATALAAAAGCVRVHPYQRERLADPAMQAPVWPALERIDDHTREVGEGTGGATSSGGGGCGCN
ncbi:MAG TPA: DUF4266 domain-containing protein [Kofleriaceae bacterium]|nr:DUF4266 domain-containing protein [Kofleriaceae bacterium]